jgi:hypothetical protein
MGLKVFAAAALSAALALSPMSARPAAADNDDIAKILLGLAAIGVIVRAARDRDERAERRNPPPVEIEHPRRWRVLPAECEFEVQTRHGSRSVVGERCMDSLGVRLDRLPEQCAFDIRTDRGLRAVYGVRCLRDEGFVIEAGRR